MTAPTVRIRSVLRDGVGGQDGAALILAILFILVIAAASLAVAAVTLDQVTPSQFEKKTGRTVHAAEAGFDASLNRIRAANDGTGNGVPGLLPCGPIGGSVGPNEGSLTYTVAIRYYVEDPTGRDNAWRSANAINCTASGLTVAPGFALLQSTGAGTDIPGSTAGAGNRSLETVYRFKVTNKNVPGGLIHVHDQLTALCLDVSDNQGVDLSNQLTIQPCDRNNPGQIWSYTKDLLLQVTADNGTLLCLQSEPAGTDTGKPPIKLAACDPTDPQQVWSFNDVGRFEGTDDGTSTNGWCFTSLSDPSDATAGSQVVPRQACSGGYDWIHTFSPEPQVGAGAAGESIGNLVNYHYFGRCLDVTNQNVDWTWLIGYPCKQKPDPSLLTWNQVFNYNGATQQYYTNSPSGQYCLQPGDSSNPPVVGTRVLTKPCTTGERYQKWTRTGDTGVYASSYNVVNDGGLCLSLTVPGPPEADAYLSQWGFVVVETCDGTTKQKWNAPAQLLPGGLQNTFEKPGG
jgi:Ricin-type beta-trefoil lectin domain